MSRTRQDIKDSCFAQMRSSDGLFQLIKSLSKGDKRNFKLFARLQEGDKKYIQLFDAIDRQEDYDEKKILEQFKGERFTKQFSVAKNYLYNYILKTLHVFHKDQYTELSTLLHQVQILMGKNLFEQAQKILRKAKSMAEKQERFQEILYLLEMERLIYNRAQQTGHYEIYIQEIKQQEIRTLEAQRNYVEYNQLFDDIYLLLKKSITARVEQDSEIVERILSNHLIANETTAISVSAQIRRRMIIADCHRFRHNFEEALQQSLEVEALLESNPAILYNNVIRYITILSNIGAYYYSIGQKENALDSLHKIKNIEIQNEQELIRVFESFHYLKLLISLELGDIELGKSTLSDIEDDLQALDGKLRKSTELSIFYSAAYLHIMSAEPHIAQKWLNRILNEPRTELRIDLQCMARILHLIVHFELDNKDVFDYHLKSAIRFISKRKRLFKFERTIIRYLNEISQNSSNRIALFEEFKAAINALMSDTYERQAAKLFDIIAWIDSKLFEIPMHELVANQAQIENKAGTPA